MSPQPAGTSHPRRTVRACDQCRRRKVKCSGKSGCVECFSLGMPCSYGSQVTHTTGSAYVLHLEKKIARLEKMLQETTPSPVKSSQDGAFNSWPLGSKYVYGNDYISTSPENEDTSTPRGLIDTSNNSDHEACPLPTTRSFQPAPTNNMNLTIRTDMQPYASLEASHRLPLNMLGGPSLSVNSPNSALYAISPDASSATYRHSPYDYPVSANPWDNIGPKGYQWFW